MTNATESEAARARAAARSKQQATSDNRTAVDVARIAEAEKTARLRALRLAKEKSDQIAAEVRRARRQR